MSDKIDELTKLLHKGKKPFSYKTHFQWGDFPGSSRWMMAKKGCRAWRINVYATRPPAPAKYFSALLSAAGGGSPPSSAPFNVEKLGYIGYIGGFFAEGRQREGKTSANSLFVVSCTAETLEKLPYMVSTEEWKDTLEDMMRKNYTKWGEAYEEYLKLKAEFDKGGKKEEDPTKLIEPGTTVDTADDITYKPIVAARSTHHYLRRNAETFRMMYDDLVNIYSLADDYREVVLEYFKEWADAFIDAAIHVARQFNCKYIVLAGSKILAKMEKGKGESSDIGAFIDIYDSRAKRLGLTPMAAKVSEQPRERSYTAEIGDFYWGEVSNVQMLGEAIRKAKAAVMSHVGALVSTYLLESVNIDEDWTEHLRLYMDVFLEHLGGVDRLSMLEEEERTKILSQAFGFWKESVDSKLLEDEEWMKEVDGFMLNEYGFEIKEM